ncbi:RING/U-box superfamily protein [Zea mays]|uniref:RING-type E3 ubiquitin transferase n=1 Tax=Zea mays TaxID=4577 RepID=A0A1D6GM12_MAIZE|nr:RING/U-box superfamily protein [Zea mays]
MFHNLIGERDSHRHITMEGITEVLAALERIEQQAELTYDQLLMLEANLVFGAFASYDRHRDMRMDIDDMSYEELLALEERIGSVSTALSEEQFTKCLKRSIYTQVALEVNKSTVDDMKCSICQVSGNFT